MPILFLVATLVVCAVVSIVVMYLANLKPSRDFKKLSSRLDLNFALLEQTGFLQMSKPALIGNYYKRHIQISVEGRDNNGNVLTQLLMTSDNGSISFVIKKKPWLERNFYSYKYKDLQAKNNLLMGDRTFDKYFGIHSNDKKRVIRGVFSQHIRQFLLKSYDNISGDIIVKDFEILMLDNQLLGFKQSNESQQKRIKDQLKFLDSLANLIDNKVVSINQSLKVNTTKSNENLNFKWGRRG